MTTSALILAGHGSHISPQTAGLVWHHVDGIRQLGIFDEVTAAFWKGAPSFHTVFNSLTATDITIVPLFTSQGYFTQTVIPAEMGLSGPITIRDGKTIRYAKTLGEHPYLSQVVMERIGDAMKHTNADPAKTAIAIIGHSTRRNPESRKATEAQADSIRARREFAEVVAVYLDDTPSIPEVYSLTSAPTLIVVPYFLALGSHTTIDVPSELGLLRPGGFTDSPSPSTERGAGGEVNGRRVYYTLPVGTDDSLQAAILELARDAGAPLHEPGANLSPWAGFPRRGNGPLIGPIGQLDVSLTVVHRIGDHEPLTAIDDLSALRALVRGDEKRFRPLATSNDLSGGWKVLVDPADPAGHLRAIIETIYPGLLGDQCEFHLSPLSEVIARQTGMFRELVDLSSAQVAETVAAVCANCVRQPTWYTSENDNSLPCPEACNAWLSKALELRHQ